MKRFFTIGMAGHIDHGKTTLTKSLTGINTDRLKEEKERQLSIEPGYALLIDSQDVEVSIVDVPGHERFIRQMIAGVVGIDFVILVIAANEGVMPQTKEHLHILSLLGIEHGMIVITKIDQADDELRKLVIEDVKKEVNGTFLQDKPLYEVDSLSKKGIDSLRSYLKRTVLQLEQKNRDFSFRLPIDQVFTLKGQGVIVRGTIFDGSVSEGDELTLLPDGVKGRVRQIQSHNKRVKRAYAGQRTAINLGGITYQTIKRGDVLVKDDVYQASDRIDVVLYPLKDIKYKVKQRLFVKLHVGTSEVHGTLIFFDRNELRERETDEILCQLQLDEKVVMKRGDKFIIRRATPVETIGGGWIIEPYAKRHRFGKETIKKLAALKEGTKEQRMLHVLNDYLILSEKELMKKASVTRSEIEKTKHQLVDIDEKLFTTEMIYEQVKNQLLKMIKNYHKSYPLRRGINKAELISLLKARFNEELLEYALERLVSKKKLKMIDEFISDINFVRTYPENERNKLKQFERKLEEQGAQLEPWDELMKKSNICGHLQTDFYYFLIETKRAYLFDEKRIIAKKSVDKLSKKLKDGTNKKPFTLQMARDILHLSRKNLIPLLELFDRLGFTRRKDNIRKWNK